MIRELVNRMKGRKKLVEKSLSLEEVVNLLQRLTPSIRIDLSYNEETNQFNWFRHSPPCVAAFLKSQFGEHVEKSPPSGRYQLYIGRRSVKAYIDLNGSNKKANLSYLI